jgi:hypothetical protein
MRCQSLLAFPASCLLLASTLACTSSRGGRKSAVPSSDATNGSEVVSSDIDETVDDTEAPDATVTDEDTLLIGDALDSDLGGPDVAVDTADTAEPDAGPSPLALQGGLLLIQVETSQVQNASISASIDTVPAPTPTPLQVEGPCQLLPEGSAAPGATIPSLDAGLITVTGLSQPVTLTPTTVGESYVRYGSGLPESTASLLSPQSPVVTATAAGGASVPAFTVEVTVPKQVNVTSPTQKVGADADLGVKWTADTATFMRVDLFVYDSEKSAQASGPIIACAVDGDPGTLAVPKALLSKLPDLGSNFLGIERGYLVVAVSRVNVGETPVSAGKVSFGISRAGGTAVAFDP